MHKNTVSSRHLRWTSTRYPSVLPYRGVLLLRLSSCVLALLVATNSTWAQEESEEDSENQDEEVIEELVTTGSRLSQSPSEITGQVIVIDEEDIRASGEVTLERLLRQLPQNLNPTTERFGSNLNNVQNFAANSTVNLRGLGSESTLILVDGKRIGYHGILGGVTDVSAIPLEMVERIEIVLDGASAVYGSDAVGGVVNIITKKDIDRVEVSLGYDRPTSTGFDETRAGIKFTYLLGQVNIRGAYQHSSHSGLDASDREVTLFQQSIFPGPQFDIRFCCLADGTSLPIAYRLDGRILTQPEFNELSDSDKGRAQGLTHAVLPDGFSADSSLNDISEWSEPTWGAATQEGFDVLPESIRDSFFGGLTTEISPWLSADVQLRGELRNVLNRQGYITLTGETLTGRSPYNPFDRTVHVRGQRRDYPQPFTDTEVFTLDLGIELSGQINEQLDYEVSFGQTISESETQRHYTVDRSGLRAGMNSDGVTPITRFLSGETRESCAQKGGTFFFGLCRVSEPPPPPVNPFGDISAFIADTPLNAESTNSQFRFEAILRGQIFSLPAGRARGLIGISGGETGLESFTEFPVGAIEQSPVSNVANFHTEANRSNQSYFGELAIPLVSNDQAISAIDSLTLSFSFRNDSYDAPEVTYFDSSNGSVEATDLMDPGSENSYGMGIAWTPIQDIKIKLNAQSAFVAPQLNQLLLTTERQPNEPFRGLYLQSPDGSLRYVNILVVQGGNDELLPETADTTSFGVEFAPSVLPSLRFITTYSEIDYQNRINRLSNFIVDPDNLPSDTYFSLILDMYVQERRWINVSSVVREGVDYELLWFESTNSGEFSAKLKYSTIWNYDYVIDPENPEQSERISVVGTATGNTAVGVVPENSMNANFVWSHRGLDIALDLGSRSRTETVFSGVKRQYTAPKTIDLSVSYAIHAGGLIELPQVLEGSRISLVFNNLFDSFGESRVFDSNGSPLPVQSTDRSPLYGRMLNVSLNLPL